MFERDKFRIHIRVKSVTTEKRILYDAGDFPYGPFGPSSEEVTFYTIKLGELEDDRYVVLRDWREDDIPDCLRKLEGGCRLTLEPWA